MSNALTHRRQSLLLVTVATLVHPTQPPPQNSHFCSPPPTSNFIAHYLSLPTFVFSSFSTPSPPPLPSMWVHSPSQKYRYGYWWTSLFRLLEEGGWHQVHHRHLFLFSLLSSFSLADIPSGTPPPPHLSLYVCTHNFCDSVTSLVFCHIY